MNDEIVYSDKRLRRRTVLLTLMFMLMLVPIVLLTQGYLRDLEVLAKNDPNGAFGKAITLTYIWGIFFVAGVLTMSVYFMWFGIKIVKADRYPPPNMRVVRDTKVVKGRGAKLRGAFLIAASVLVFLSGVVTVTLGAKFISNSVKESHEKE